MDANVSNEKGTAAEKHAVYGNLEGIRRVPKNGIWVIKAQ